MPILLTIKHSNSSCLSLSAVVMTTWLHMWIPDCLLVQNPNIVLSENLSIANFNVKSSVKIIVVMFDLQVTSYKL